MNDADPLARELRAMAAEDLRVREQAQREGDHPPRDWAARQADMLKWLRETGWRE